MPTHQLQLNRDITFGSLFTGVGGFDLGFERAGMRCLWQVEIDDSCNRVLRRHWPKTTRYRDVNKCSRKLARPNVICLGFPCQDESVAGARAGLGGKRSGLWFPALRIIERYLPDLVVIENVPGLFSTHGGRDFLTILRGLAQLGYLGAYGVLDAQYFHVPQRRERPFIIGGLGNCCAAEILFEPESLSGDPPTRGPTGEGAAPTVTQRAGTSGQNDFATSGGLVPEIARCLNAGRDGYNDGSDQTYLPEAAESGQVISTARLASFGEYVEDGTAGTMLERNYKDATDLAVIATPITHKPHSDRGAEAGNLLVADPICANEQRTSTHEGNSFRTRNLMAFSCKDSGQDAGEDVAPTLRTMNNVDGNANGGGQVAIADAAQVQWSSGGGKVENPTSQTLRAGAEHNYQFARVGRGVRRLTPRECERLQGFPESELHVTFELCSDPQKFHVNAARQSLRSRGPVGTAGSGGIESSARFAARSFQQSDHRNDRLVPLAVHISCVDDEVELRSGRSGLKSFAFDAANQGWSRLHTAPENFVRLIAGIVITADQTIPDGEAELHLSEQCSIHRHNGRLLVRLCGNAITRRVKDALHGSITQCALSKSTIESLLNSKSTERRLEILFCSVVHATSGFILGAIGQGDSFRLELSTRLCWTRYDDKGNELKDSPRYRMMGNAVNVKVSSWIGQRIMKYGIFK